MSIEHRMDLFRHSSSSAEMVRAIEVLVRRSSADELRLSFRLEGDISRILIRPPRDGTELWRHTCFEAFVAREGQQAYHEFNFAPSGEWTVYAFRSYRSGSIVTNETMRPDIVIRSTDSRLEVDTVVHLDALSAVHPRAALRLGLSAIIESSEGLSYWALRHPAAKPDFHNAEGFALRLGPHA
ncbi:MAG TPA: DOMON-like domain-containing protein [Candidatus Binataceae bacterium]|nr:DOMON-like domain-containing protein [Candidatus Binataceae bacterium]